VFFKFSSEVTGIAAHLGKGGPLEFRFDSPKVISVCLGHSYPDGAKPRESSDAVCISTTAAEPPSREIAERLKVGWTLPVVDGKIQEGDPATEFLDMVFGELPARMESTVSLFRWRQGIAEGPPDPCHTMRAHYSEDGEALREVSLVRGVRITWGLTGPGAPRADACNDVVELAAESSEEPLGRQLFREAWTERKSRPRSSLVIGVAAAEVGFKKLVGALVPQAQWLVDEVQTPALSKMLSKFLPTLPIRAKFIGKTVRPPKALLNKLDEAVQRRNKLVHAGQPPPRWDELEEMLRAVNDFLWICDLYQGHEWAAKHISHETQKAWPRDSA
jgi:hypothetical protein